MDFTQAHRARRPNGAHTTTDAPSAKKTAAGGNTRQAAVSNSLDAVKGVRA